MRNQFFYKRKVNTGDKIYTFLDSFNLNSVIRGVHQYDGTFVVLLDDGHEESVVTQQAQGKNPEKRERKWYDSQIVLDAEDRRRFQLLSSVDDPIDDVPPVVVVPPSPKETLAPEEVNGNLDGII